MSGPFPFAGEACALASSLLWAVSFLVFARVRVHVSPGALNLGKNLAATLCFAATFLVLQGVPWPVGLAPEALLLFAASGIVGFTLCDTLLLRSMRDVGPQRASLLMSLSVPLSALGALAPPWSERPGVWAFAGMGVTLAGLALAILERPPDPVRREDLRRGVRRGVLAAVLQAVGLLLARRGYAVAPGAAAEGAMVRLAAGVLGLVVVGAATGRLGRWATALRPGRSAAAIAGGAFLGTFLGIWANQAGLAWVRHTGVAVTLNSLSPVLLIPLTTLFLGERHGARSWTSTVLACLGVALLTAP
jgi:drug/metabolite transporter (DMT)-like permease